MNINNPPVFNRIIASGGEIGTVAVANNVMQWSFDNVAADVAAVRDASGVRTGFETVSAAWNMQTNNAVNLQFTPATDDVIEMVAMLVANVTGAIIGTIVDVVTAGNTLVTGGVFTAVIADVGGAASVQLQRNASSRYNGASYTNMTAVVSIRYKL